MPLDKDSQMAREPRKQHPVLDWLSINDFAARQRDIIAKRQAGTAHLMFGSRRFAAWAHGRSKTLLCHGIPGVGKTMAAAIAADFIIRWKRSNRIEAFNIGAAWVFCNYRSQTTQGVSALLAAILRQLVECRPDLLPIVEHLHDGCKEDSSRPSRDKLFDALRQVCSRLTYTYIIVDALDECSDQYGARSQLIEQLQRLQTEADVRLLFTSRPISEVIIRAKADIILKLRTSGDDIARYVKSQFHRMCPIVQQSVELQQDILRGVIVAAEGV